MKPFLNLKSVDEVEKIIFSLPRLNTERIPLDNALGRRLARPFTAPEDLPGFARSTMDGYALKARDVFGASEGNPAFLQICGVCKMGQIPAFSISSGNAAIIHTGAPLPSGADAVVMIEHTRKVGENQIEVTHSIAPGMNIVERDEDAPKGKALLSASSLLRPQEIGIMAAYGILNLEVYRPCRVAVISTGDEVVPAQQTALPGQIRDVNSWTLAAICNSTKSEVIQMGIIPDDPAILRKTLATATNLADVILVSGGSSAGMRDHTVEAFESLPEARLLVHGVSIRPGKPFILAQSQGKVLAGLPGHVSGTFFCSLAFIKPLLQHLQGAANLPPAPWIDVCLSRPVASAQGRRDYIPCKLRTEANNFTAEPLLSSSAVISNLLEADGYIICMENSEGLLKGQQVKFYPF